MINSKRIVRLEFQSSLFSTSVNAWKWITSRFGINKELFPIMRMTGLKILEENKFSDLQFGKPICNSWLLLFGIFPVDCSKLTIIDAEEYNYFIEESSMFFMKYWRHERYVIEQNDQQCIVKDILSFESKMLAGLTTFFVKVLFTNRHRNLCKYFNRNT